MAQILLLSLIFCLIPSLTMTWNYYQNFDILSKHHVVRRDVNINCTKILNFWKEHKSKLIYQDEHKEVVLMLGNTGAGKSTIVSALTGQKLKSVKQGGGAYRVFVDGEGRIGTGLKSKTLVPEAITDKKRNITYVDCPGFRDNRDAEYEISSIYFQNIFMSQVEKIKIVLVINYDSLKSNGNKNDFDDLFEHVSEFIRNISKFHDGIALVATKVENVYDWSDDEDTPPVLANDDQSVLEEIADYLKRKQEIYQNKSEDSVKYKVFADLIDVLVQKKNDSYSRIAILRQPTREGELEKLKKTKNEINTIENMLTENIHFIEKNVDDFSFALSAPSKMLVDRIVDDIFRNALMDRLHKMGNETYTHCLQTEKQHNDIGILRNQFRQAYELISKIRNVNKPLDLFKVFLDATNTLNISVSQSNLNDISDDVKELQFFTTLSNSNGDIHMMLLQNGVQNVLNLIENLKNIYDFLNNLQENLATYKSQELKGDDRIERIMLSCLSLKAKAVQNMTELENIVKEIGSDEIYQKVKTLQLNRLQLNRMKDILDDFTHKLTFSCTSEQLTVKGYNVKINDVVKIDCWTQAKRIHIFALNKIFIDDTIDKKGAEAQISILAPTWEVVGRPKIILDGKTGRARGNTYTTSPYHWQREEDGSQGLPGGPAGHFFGVGKQFINFENLEIHANGGEGGPGQRGRDGVDGVEGDTLPRSFFYTQRTKPQCKAYFKEHGYLAIMFPEYGPDWNEGTNYAVIYGTPAKVKPGRGGHGGEGGHGGYPGTIMINGLGKSVNVTIFNNTGSRGWLGRGGNGGKKTYDGTTVSFHVERSFPLFGSFKYVENSIKYSDYPAYMEVLEVPAGKDGETGASTKDEVFPTKLSMENPYFAINAFKGYIRENLIKNTRESDLNSFMEDLDNTNYIKAEYNTLIFVREFEELENQYLKLRNKIDFAPFYNSLLSRIETFANSEKSLENKKVLSFIYTAALTKAFALKKRKKGKTVVNLYKYLDTIELSINEVNMAMHLQIVQNYRNEYNYTLTKKIREANDFIKNKIEPEINQLWKQSNNQIKALIDEIQKSKNAPINEIAKLEKEREKVYNMMQWNSILRPIRIAAACLSFLGTIGAVVSAVITSTSSVAKGMVIDETSDNKKNAIPSIDIVSELPSYITEVFGYKPKQLADQFVEVVTQLKEYNKESIIINETKNENSVRIENLEREIHKIKNTVPHTIEETSTLHESAVMIREKLIEFTSIQINILEKEKNQTDESKPEQKNEKKVKKDVETKKSLNLMKKVQSLFKDIKTVNSVAKQLGDNDEQIENINQLINQHGQQLKNLEQMEDQVYEKVVPDLLQIERTINEMKASVNGSSHVKLDISKWTVSTTLKDVKLLLQKLSHKISFELRSNLERFIEKIDEGFSILIDIYDRIDTYSDSVKQAEYIAHIESASMDNIPVTDPELSEAIINLKLIIHSNVLTEKYEIALHAFKQHYFPFAAHVLQRFQLPPSLRLNKTETLRTNIINRIKDMKNHIDETEATIGEYSKFIHENNIFNANTTGSSPFYVWTHETVKDEIQKLLNGSEILVKADISKGLNCNAVKYNDIGINFKLKNETLQNNFTSILKNFALTMTMVGNNYYRCGERYYHISFDDDLTISYNLDKDESKNWINSNLVYTTIHRSHAFLSPYGMWSIKLKNIDSSVSWDHLRNFANETIDMELVGHGYYIEQDPGFNFEVCNAYLDTFYDAENMVKELE